jgi:hypothetical protein
MALEQRDPSLGVCKDEGWSVVSLPAENVHLGEQGGYMRNWRGSCLVLTQTRDEMYELLTNLQDNEPAFWGCMRIHVQLISSQRLNLAPSVRPCCA